MSEFKKLEALCDELRLLLIVVRDPDHGWAAKIKHNMQPHPIVTGAGASMKEAIDNLIERAFRVVEEFRPRIKVFNQAEMKKRTREMRRMGLT